MGRRRKILSGLAIVAMVSILSGCSPSGQDSSDSALSSHGSALHHAMDAAMKEYHIPGMAVYVAEGAGASAATWTGVAGDAVVGSAKVAPSTRFAYRSITKSFTVTVILKLVEQGKLSLDLPVAHFVPGVPNGEAITIRDLAGMRSGLANYSALPAFQQALVADPTRSWTTDELLGYAFSVPADFAPGARYEYSNTNTILLGQVIQAVTGQTWQAEVAKTITRPLGLDSVVYPDNGSFPSPAATGYADTGKPEAQPSVKTSLFGAAGGLVGTIGDLGKWATALGSGQLLTPSLQKDRETDPSDTAEDPDSPLYTAYGLGMGKILVHGTPWWGHTGVGVGYQSLAMYDAKDRTTVAILINVTNKDQDVPARILPKLLSVLDANG